MKTKNLLCLFFFMATFLMNSCNSGQKTITGTELADLVTIIKIKDPVCLKNVIVWSNDDMEKMFLMRGNKCEHTFWTSWPSPDLDGSILGSTDEVNFPERYRDPFWELSDGWYLIDWAWCNLKGDAYPYLGYTILTDVTFENLYEYGTCKFDKSVPHISKPKNELYETKTIHVGDLMAYLHPNGKYESYEMHYYDSILEKDTVHIAPNQYFFHCWLGGYLPVASNANTCLCGLADQVDAYWAELQNQLTILIKNGDLNKMKHFDTKTLFADK